MTTNLVHNAIVHNLPHRGTVWLTTMLEADTVVLTVENTGEELTPQLVSTLVEPFQRGTERIRGPRWRRPRAGHRRHHRPCTRRESDPHPTGYRRALRHGPSPGFLINLLRPPGWRAHLARGPGGPFRPGHAGARAGRQAGFGSFRAIGH